MADLARRAAVSARAAEMLSAAASGRHAGIISRVRIDVIVSLRGGRMAHFTARYGSHVVCSAGTSVTASPATAAVAACTIPRGCILDLRSGSDRDPVCKNIV